MLQAHQWFGARRLQNTGARESSSALFPIGTTRSGKCTFFTAADLASLARCLASLAQRSPHILVRGTLFKRACLPLSSCFAVRLFVLNSPRISEQSLYKIRVTSCRPFNSAILSAPFLYRHLFSCPPSSRNKPELDHLFSTPVQRPFLPVPPAALRRVK